MRCQRARITSLAAMLVTGVSGCKSGQKSAVATEQPLTSSPAPGVELVGNAREVLAALLAVESRADVVGWPSFRRLDRFVAGKELSGAAIALEIAAAKALVRGLWSKASSRAGGGEVTAADIESATRLPSAEVPPAIRARLPQVAADLGFKRTTEDHVTAEHWRLVLSVIADEIHLAGADALEPMGGKAIEALAIAATALQLELLASATALATEAGAAAIDGEHIKAAYKALSTRLELGNQPRSIKRLSRLDAARTLIPITRELLENKAKALAANDRASGDLSRDLDRVAGLDVSPEAAAALYADALSLVTRATRELPVVRADNLDAIAADLSTAEPAMYVDHIEADNALQQLFPHRLFENGDIEVRLERNPALAISGGREPVELRIPAGLIDGVRATSAGWRALADVFRESPYAIDPLAAEIVAEAVSMHIARSIHRAETLARAAGEAQITGEIARQVAPAAIIQMPAEGEPDPATPRLPSPFVDVSAGAGFPAELDGVGSSEPGLAMGGGIAVGDVDRDGTPDLFVAGEGLGRLMLNRGKGRSIRFEDATEAVGLPETLGDSRGALLFDLEGDGDLDLLILRGDGPAAIYRSDGGTFADASKALGFESRGAHSGHVFDLEGDGDLDIYLGVHGGDGPAANQLWRNDDGRLVEVGAKAGVAGAGRTMAVGSFDLEMDGDIDLYAANAAGANALYRNNGDGTFTDVGAATRTADRGSSRSLATAELNGDGRWDLYVTNIDREPRWVELSLPGDGATIDIDDAIARATLDRSGNKLLVSTPRGLEPAGARLAPGERGWGWDAVFFDVDLDGDDDLYQSNGWVDGSGAANQRNQLLIRDGEVFAATVEGGAERFAGNTRSVAAADLDRDGDIDLVCNQFRKPPVVLENRGRFRDRWIRVSLADSKAAANPRGVGATISIKTGAGVVLRQISGGRGYLGQDEPVAHAGVGSARLVDVTVRWPDGAETSHRRLPTSRAHELSR